MPQGVLDNTEAPGIGSGTVRERGKKSVRCNVALQRTLCEHYRSFWELVVIRFATWFGQGSKAAVAVVTCDQASTVLTSPCHSCLTELIQSIKVTAARECRAWLSQTDRRSAWFVISVYKISNIIFIQPLRAPVEKFKFLLDLNCNHFQLCEDSIFLIYWVVSTPKVVGNCTGLEFKPLTFLDVLEQLNWEQPSLRMSGWVCCCSPRAFYCCLK